MENAGVGKSKQDKIVMVKILKKTAKEKA